MITMMFLPLTLAEALKKYGSPQIYGKVSSSRPKQSETSLRLTNRIQAPSIRTMTTVFQRHWRVTKTKN
jgi:hypothetical protein